MQLMNAVWAATGVLWLAAVARGQTPAQFEDHHLFASDGAVGDRFGYSVSVSGDVCIVGARFDETVVGIRAGSAYTFKFNGTNWVEESHLFATDGEAEDRFGNSVSVSGDVAIVGAEQDDTIGGGVNAGSAYIFRYNGTTWVEEAHLFASDGEAQDFFGNSVSVSGDIAIVGAFRDTTVDGNGAGSAYIFRFNGSTWIEESHLFASDAAGFDWFGFSVSISGEVAVVGAIFNDPIGGSFTGSVYFYRFTGVNWVEEAHLFAADGMALYFFGSTVSVSGDVAIVGMTYDFTPGNPPGSAFVYRFNGKTWVEESRLFASDGSVADHFGESVSINGDVAIVGAFMDTTVVGIGAGSAYTFRFNGSSWKEEAHLFASDGAVFDQFSSSVAISGNVAMVGASSDATVSGNAAGSAYVFNICGPPIICTGDITPACGDGIVDIIDLMEVINTFGSCPASPLPCAADIAPPGPPVGNGVVNIDDLVALLSAFGPCS